MYRRGAPPRSAASALLNKATHQLKGGTGVPMPRTGSNTRAEDDDDDDDIGAYLNSLNRKTHQNPAHKAEPDWEKFGELSDTSLGDADLPLKTPTVTTANKFLKKKKQPDVQAVPSPKVHKSAQQATSKLATMTTGQSAALNKAAAFNNKYQKKDITKHADISESDLDMDMSMDEDVMASVTKSLPSQKSVTKQPAPKQSPFIKAKTATSAPELSPIKSLKSPKGEQRVSNVQVVSDIESLTEVKEHAIDSDSDNLMQIKQYNFSDTEEVDSFHKQDGGDSDEDSVSLGSFKMNIMGLEELEPVAFGQSATSPKTKEPAKKKSDKKIPKPTKDGKGPPVVASNSFFASMGIHTLDELPTPAEERPASPLKSILAQTPRSPTPRSSRSKVRLSIDDIRTPSPEIISTARDRASSVIHTEEEVDYDDNSFIESIKSEDDETGGVTSRRLSLRRFSSSSFSRRHSASSYSSRRHSEEYYSDDFTSATEVSKTSRRHSYSRSSSRESDATDYSGSPRSPSPNERRKKRVSTREIEVQTGGDVIPALSYHWSLEPGVAVSAPPLGLESVDPTPIASHVVSADALEAITAYSPCSLVLNDMLRQNIQLTKDFIHIQQSLYQTYSNTIIPNYNYTTLQDTKEYIKAKKKPTITFDEALKQVKEEMGMS